MAGAHSAAILRTLCMTTERRNLFDLSWRAIAKVLVAAALVWAWFQLWQFVMVMIVSIIMAIALDPSVRWLERRRLSRSMGSVVVMLLVSAVLMAMIAASWMTLRDQSQLIVQRLTESIEQLRTSIPILQHVFPTGGEGASGGVSSYVVGFARSATTAIGMIVLALALTVYLLIEWKRTLEWLMAFVPERHRSKARKTLEEARGIVFHYAVGNAISSAITGIVTYAVLAWLGVPAAFMLALISGMLNFIPVIGFILSSVLAAMLAATVSTEPPRAAPRRVTPVRRETAPPSAPPPPILVTPTPTKPNSDSSTVTLIRGQQVSKQTFPADSATPDSLRTGKP